LFFKIKGYDESMLYPNNDKYDITSGIKTKNLYVDDNDAIIGPEWIQWIKQNIKNNCNKIQLIKILTDNKFDASLK
jgi:hypothetical protein